MMLKGAFVESLTPSHARSSSAASRRGWRPRRRRARHPLAVGVDEPLASSEGVSTQAPDRCPHGGGRAALAYPAADQAACDGADGAVSEAVL